MKAMIVFDVNDFAYKAIEDYFSGVITLHLGNDGFIDFQNVMLKPMPQRKYSLICGDSDGNRWEEPSEYDIGYNACIDEILGGN